MNHREHDARNRLEATASTPLLRHRDTPDPRKIERKLQADVAAWLRARNGARSPHR